MCPKLQPAIKYPTKRPSNQTNEIPSDTYYLGREDSKMVDIAKHELHKVVEQWDCSMVENNADAIGRFIADEWVIIGPDGSASGKEHFLALVESGELSHSVMETHDMELRLYGNTAVTVAIGISGGLYKGEQFLLRERVSCVFIKEGDTWQCVLTHLSLLPEPPA